MTDNRDVLISELEETIRLQKLRIEQLEETATHAWFLSSPTEKLRRQFAETFDPQDARN